MEGRIVTKTNEASRVAEIGTIKVGRKEKRGGKEIPVSTDYFIADGKYKSKFYDVYEPEPSKIEIFFPSDDIRQVCNERLELRSSKNYDGVGGRLLAFGDGENFDVWAKNKGVYVPIKASEKPELINEMAEKAGTEWYSVLTLRFMILKIKGVWGFWRFSTKAEASSIPQIINTFDYMKEVTGANFVKIPFDLIVTKVVSQKPGTQHSYPIVNLIPHTSQEQLEKVADMTGEIKGLLTSDKIDHYIEDKSNDTSSHDTINEQMTLL